MLVDVIHYCYIGLKLPRKHNEPKELWGFYCNSSQRRDDTRKSPNLRWPDGSIVALEPEDGKLEEESDAAGSDEDPPEEPRPASRRRTPAEPKPKASRGRTKAPAKPPKAEKGREPSQTGGRAVNTENYNHASYNDMPDPSLVTKKHWFQDFAARKNDSVLDIQNQRKYTSTIIVRIY